MKKLLLFLFSLLLFALPAVASTQTEWTIVTSSETIPNAIPVQYDQNGTPINCAGQNPDNPNATDSGHVGPSGDCYNPLTITFDLNAPSTDGQGNWGPIQAAVVNAPINYLMVDNSVGSYDGSAPSITVALKDCVYTIVVTNEDGSVFTFTANAKADPMAGSFTSTVGDKGSVNIYNDTVPPSGTYKGTFEYNNSDTVELEFGTQPAANFTLNPVTVLSLSAKNTCFTHTMTSNDALAQTFGLNFVSGDITSVDVGDGQGNVIYILTTHGTDSNSVFLTPDATTQYVIFYVVASTNSACPVGTNSYDAPFTQTHAKLTRPPLRGLPLIWNKK